ncbi:DUF6777 domain-containing protein [Mycolicibacterium vinylchloridicum]|uniref:DUF6777 domain-containing protein n=1 Tax=Mycolicibacterium vinylchloridicum TaxID=2736928 RepID=UPI0015CBE510|nr:DUF6777 domain-containing protein [Mycolicibacterium vinylchloridicum]
MSSSPLPNNATAAGWNDPNQPPVIDSRARPVLTVAAIALTFVVLATLTVVVLLSRPRAASGPVSSAPDPLVFTEANAAGLDPFTTSVVVLSAVPAPGTANGNPGSAAQAPVSTERGVRLVSGTQHGLYGAVGTEVPCDAAALANDLSAHPDRAQSWGSTIGLQPQQIPYYLNTLTPVVLSADTWVTSHRFTSGKAVAYQTVLQAGDAVMVDPVGVPRVHCAGGSPLLPPSDGNIAAWKSADTAPWTGYSPHTTVVVAYSAAHRTTPVAEFVLVDLGSGQAVPRPSGGTIDMGPPPATIGALPDPVAINVPPAGGGTPTPPR